MSKKSVVFVNGSPKIGEDSVSGYLTTMGIELFEDDDLDIYDIHIRRSMSRLKTEEDFPFMRKADAIVFIFPLYIFCLPGIVIRFLQDYYAYWLQGKDKTNTNQRIYAVINCGFPESGINEEAAAVIQSFSEKTGSIYRFVLLIGGGGMLLGAKEAPFMKNTLNSIKDAFRLMHDDIAAGASAPIPDRYVEMNFPRKLYLFMGNRGWYSMARKNGLSKKDLLAKPYLHK